MQQGGRDAGAGVRPIGLCRTETTIFMVGDLPLVRNHQLASPRWLDRDGNVVVLISRSRDSCVPTSAHSCTTACSVCVQACFIALHTHYTTLSSLRCTRLVSSPSSTCAHSSAAWKRRYIRYRQIQSRQNTCPAGSIATLLSKHGLGWYAMLCYAMPCYAMLC